MSALTALDPYAIETRQHIIDAAIAESLDPPTAEQFLASLTRAAAARAKLNPPTPCKLTHSPSSSASQSSCR